MEVTCRGWESHLPHQMGFASISLIWDQRPGSICAASLCLILLPFGSAKLVLCQRRQGYPWLLLKAKSYRCLHCLWPADRKSYWIIHPPVNTPIIICPCFLLCSVSGHSRWHPVDCCASCFSSPAHLRHSPLIACNAAWAVPLILLSFSPRCLRGREGPELSLGANFAMIGQNRAAYKHLQLSDTQTEVSWFHTTIRVP